MIFRRNWICLFFSFGLLFLQEKCYSQVDSVVFTYKEYIENVTNFHPVAKQAVLKLAFGEAQLLKAKGGFDPTVNTDWSEKNFDGKQYYRLYQTKLRIPTPLGIDVVGGYEKNSGDFLNPEGYTDPNGLWHVGVEVDILQGLITNERRTALRQARVFQELARNEQQILLNEILFNASLAYLQWQLYHHFNIVLGENTQIALTYFNNTRESFLGGEKTAVDTLEAFILHQDAMLQLQKNEMELIKSRLNLENFLWFEDNPISLQNSTEPENYQNSILPSGVYWSDTTITSNPVILASINKLSALEIEQKLNREKLKPKLKIKYNPLLSTTSNNVAPMYSSENYNWGFVFSIPLFLRKERGELNKGRIKINEMELEIQDKRNELLNKIENSWEQQSLLEEQFTLLSQNVSNYRLLLDAENEKFRLGESSVFLLNKRQEKYINSRLKLIDNRINYQTEQLKFLFFTNQLVEK